MKPIYAVILAGDQEDRRVRKDRVIDNKAFLDLKGRLMLDYVVECYTSANIFDGVAVIGPARRLQAHLGNEIRVIEQQGGMIENVIQAAKELDGWLLLSSCDIPLLTPAAVRDFLDRCEGGELYYPLVSREDNDKEYPGMKRTYVSLREGIYTGGNVILVHSTAVPIAAPAAGSFFDARKSPLRMARLIGTGTLLKLLAKRLSVAELERKMSQIFGIACKAVVSGYPELGIDLDKESDYTLIAQRLTAPAKSR